MDKFQFTKDEFGNIKFYDMAGNPIPAPDPDLQVKVISTTPKILPMGNQTKGRAGISDFNLASKQRVFVR